MLRKFTSRKFILALASIIAGICALFGLDDLAAQLTGALTSLCSAVAYIMSEGLLDREAIIGKWADGEDKTDRTTVLEDDDSANN